jgi:transposase
VIDTSKPIKDGATAYGVCPETLRNWLGKYRETHGGVEADLTVSERARPGQGHWQTASDR